jgi:hypothetical protein
MTQFWDHWLESLVEKLFPAENKKAENSTKSEME